MDRPDRALEHAILSDRQVVLVLEPVEMDREGEIGAGIEEVLFLFEQKRVGAEIDEALARDQCAHDPRGQGGRRDGDALHPQFGHEIEERRDPLGLGVVE